MRVVADRPDFRRQARPDVAERLGDGAHRGERLQAEGRDGDADERKGHHVEHEEAQHRAHHLVADRLVVVGRLQHAVRMDEVADLPARAGHQHADAEQLDATRGRAGAGADEQQHHHRRRRHGPPGQEVLRGESGRSGDRHDIEARGA